MRIYTRTGDRGGTVLAGGSRVSKSSPRVSAYGEVDELNALIGVLRSEPVPDSADQRLNLVQNLLLEVGAFLADPRGRHPLPPQALEPAWLEEWIDEMEEDLPSLRNFILPGGNRTSSLAHLSRTVCRRVERAVVALHDAGDSVADVIPLLNRLSDALFVLARWCNARAGVADVTWQASR